MSLVYYSPDHPELRYVALGLFVFGMCADVLDGWIARHFNQRTQLGTLLDPIADKTLILGTLISLSAIRGLPDALHIPAWFNVIVISRDVLLVAGSLVIFFTQGRWDVVPSRLGKWTTASQMLVVPVVLLGLPIKLAMIILASVLTVCSGIQYVRRGLRAYG